MKQKKNSWKLFALPGLLLCSCVGDAQFRSYVLADRLFFDVQKRHYEQLLDASPLTVEDKATHMGRMTAKEAQLSAAEKALGLKE